MAVLSLMLSCRSEPDSTADPQSTGSLSSSVSTAQTVMAYAGAPFGATSRRDPKQGLLKPYPAEPDDYPRPSKPRAKKEPMLDAAPAPLKKDKSKLVAFATAPFPYNGKVPWSNQPFLNVSDGDRRGHRSPFGRIYWEDQAYNDPRVLLHIPKGFDIRRPGLMIVFFHGHGATLERDVSARQQVPRQISESQLNAVLVAPQLAFDARDSSPGKFWEPGGFQRFLAEAADKLAQLHGDPRSKQVFANMPVVIVAYSGGYLATAACLYSGGIKGRVRGVVLLDALYGELDKFAAWIANHRSAFFVSAFADSTRIRNAQLERILAQRDVTYSTDPGQRLKQGSVNFISTSSETRHRDFVTHAWVDDPIKDVLQRLKWDEWLTASQTPETVKQ